MEENEERNDFVEGVQSLSTGDLFLDLSYRSLNFLPDISVSPPLFLQFLYIQGNNLKDLPSTFFSTFPALRRLDLRFNCLTTLPATVGNHTFLEILLLQDNAISSLPRELGQMPRLRKLQVSGNPLLWPPPDVICGGSEKILSFLRDPDHSSLMEQPYSKEIENRKKSNNKDTDLDDSSRKIRVPNGQETPPKMGRQQLFSNQADNPGQDDNEQAIKATFPSMNEPTALVRKFVCKENQRSTQNPERSNQGGLRLENIKRSRQSLVVVHGKRFPLGYTKRLTGAKIYKTLIQQIWNSQLRCILQWQDHTLQKLKDREARRKWQHETRQLQEKTATTRQGYPGLIPPFDIDDSYRKMIDRTDWVKFQNESLERKAQPRPATIAVDALDMENRISRLIASFNTLKSSDVRRQESKSLPEKRRQLLAGEMIKIRELQEAVKALRLNV